MSSPSKSAGKRGRRDRSKRKTEKLDESWASSAHSDRFRKENDPLNSSSAVDAHKALVSANDGSHRKRLSKKSTLTPKKRSEDIGSLQSFLQEAPPMVKSDLEDRSRGAYSTASKMAKAKTRGPNAKFMSTTIPKDKLDLFLEKIGSASSPNWVHASEEQLRSSLATSTSNISVYANTNSLHKSKLKTSSGSVLSSFLHETRATDRSDLETRSAVGSMPKAENHTLPIPETKSELIALMKSLSATGKQIPEASSTLQSSVRKLETVKEDEDGRMKGELRSRRRTADTGNIAKENRPSRSRTTEVELSPNYNAETPRRSRSKGRGIDSRLSRSSTKFRSKSQPRQSTPRTSKVPTEQPTTTVVSRASRTHSSSKNKADALERSPRPRSSASGNGTVLVNKHRSEHIPSPRNENCVLTTPKVRNTSRRSVKDTLHLSSSSLSRSTKPRLEVPIRASRSSRFEDNIEPKPSRRRSRSSSPTARRPPISPIARSLSKYVVESPAKTSSYRKPKSDRNKEHGVDEQVSKKDRRHSSKSASRSEVDRAPYLSGSAEDIREHALCDRERSSAVAGLTSGEHIQDQRASSGKSGQDGEKGNQTLIDTNRPPLGSTEHRTPSGKNTERRISSGGCSSSSKKDCRPSTGRSKAGNQKPPDDVAVEAEQIGDDIFSRYSWSSYRQDSRKIQKQRRKLRDSIKGTPLFRTYERMEQLVVA